MSRTSEGSASKNKKKNWRKQGDLPERKKKEGTHEKRMSLPWTARQQEVREIKE